ncbi:MAG: hypothetical protein JRE16_05925 [Deltaproteobacteria bacterium]|jgi:Tfp pilus assembly protein PilN|nr:hypothetical protein [Deltaproteobacteria bacterium]
MVFLGVESDFIHVGGTCKVLLMRITVLLITLLSWPNLALSTNTDIEEIVDQQERRIEQLESEVQRLENQLHELQSANQTTVDPDETVLDNQLDPLVGIWECTNNVFNYEITFFKDGRLIQEEPSFSKTKTSRWTRTKEDQFVTAEQGGNAWSTDFSNINEVTITNLSNQATWSCSRTE